MRILKMTILAGLALGTAGCSDTAMATRNAPLPTLAVGKVTPAVVTRSYVVQDITFSAPVSLRVSESNGYYPMADVVWRGDPIGDRIAQIAAIFETAALRGAEESDGEVPVIVGIDLKRFHGVTERTRFSVGGNYNMVFMLSVRDAQTGALLEPPREVAANLSAPGGSAAVLAETRGQTEKVRVTDYLALVLEDELSGQYQATAL